MQAVALFPSQIDLETAWSETIVVHKCVDGTRWKVQTLASRSAATQVGGFGTDISSLVWHRCQNMRECETFG